MKLHKSAAALLVGALIGAVALAAPASADPPPVSGAASCAADGTWQVDWTIYNLDGHPVKFDPARTTITTKPAGTKLELTGDITTRTTDDHPIKGLEALAGKTIGIPASVTSVTLTLGITGYLGAPGTFSKKAWQPGTCVPTAAPTTGATTKPAHPGAPVPVRTTRTPVAASSSAGGGLPVTGAATGRVAAGAAVLLIAGGVLFLMARRRKVKFTA